MPSRPLSSSPMGTRNAEQSCSYGQVIEYIQDRLYLASYTHPPSPNTPFPYPTKQSRSPNKRSSRPQLQQAQPTSDAKERKQPVYFSVDAALLYNNFHADFGPFHIGHLYRFAVLLHEVLGDPTNEGKPVVFWSRADSRSRANAACILACYMVVIQSWPPHLALAPIAQMDPPLMPFRDAGYAQADYILTVQDIVYGVWKAREENLCALKDFNLEEYELFERVDMGDFNWLTPNFVAFASPQSKQVAVVSPSAPEYANIPKTLGAVDKSDLQASFKNILTHFKTRNVGLVVRLNSELYSPSYFSALGITHMDMIFEDGTCPPLTLVKKFIRLAHEMITVKDKAIAVHCKAGLGRTGCLIGAYLIYRYGFTANEVIAFMRFMRPGMVVGPQQHWLHLNQGVFRELWFEDTMRQKLGFLKQSTPPRSANRQRVGSNGPTHTPTNGSQKRRALGELDDYNEKSNIGVQDENLPAPTPGQPRKTSKLYGDKRIPFNENDHLPQPNTEIVSMERHTKGENESEDEYQLSMLARRPSRSPSSQHKRRAVSCVTTTHTTTEWSMGSDTENQPSIAKTPSAVRSGSGAGSLAVGKRTSPSRTHSDSRAGVRKTSGRVGSIGAQMATTKIKS